MGRPADPARGLSAAELAAAVDELQPLCSAEVLDAMPITAAPAMSDLLLVLQDSSGSKHFVHLAIGGTRARICTTARRFTKADFGRGSARDLLEQHLRSAHLSAITHAAGERRCAFVFATKDGERTLVIELFSARGLWALLDEDSKVVTMSRVVETAVRTLRPGQVYAPPPPFAATGRSEPPNRFAVPVLRTIDDHFTAMDRGSAAHTEHGALLRAAERAHKRALAKAAGLGQQLQAADAAGELRTRADLMLAYAHSVTRGARAMTVYDPVSGEPQQLELDPARPVAAQANALYDKARRLTNGREITKGRLAETEALATSLEQVLGDLAAIHPEDDGDDCMARLEPCRAELQRLGAALPKPAVAPPAKRTGKPRAGASRPGENYRRFTSIEGYQVLVGRNNQQNDRLTMRTANGNDLWLHVGGGRPGSHVVVKLPKHKTASLETLLDAATLAVHFSKARGERRIDVIYTQRKHVKKPKGLPAGAVAPSQTKTISVELDTERLQRLLDSSDGEE